MPQPQMKEINEDLRNLKEELENTANLQKEINELREKIKEYQYIEDTINNLVDKYRKNPELIMGITNVLAAFTVETNAETLTYTVEDLKYKGINLGDFKVTVTRTKGPEIKLPDIPNDKEEKNDENN